MRGCSRRSGVATALAATIALSGCRSQPQALERAVTAAGAQIRREAAGQTYEDLARDLDAFVQKDIVFVREKAEAKREKERSGYRILGITGLGLILAGAGTTSLPEGARIGLGVAGALATGGGLYLYQKNVGEMEACVAFLNRSEAEMRRWREENLEPSSRPVPPLVWRDYVDRTAAIEGYPKCLRVRRP